MAADYGVIRDHVSRVIPGFADFSERSDRPGGFVLPHPPRDSRTFHTPSGKGEIVVSPIEVLHVPVGHLVLQTMRSHDQYNTTIYGFSDRYHGIEGGRRVVLVHPDDIFALCLEDGQHVDLHAVWADDRERVAPRFRVVAYDTPRGSTAAYCPRPTPWSRLTRWPLAATPRRRRPLS